MRQRLLLLRLAPHLIIMATHLQMGPEWMISTLRISRFLYHLPLDGIGVPSNMRPPLQLRRPDYAMHRPVRPSTGSALPLDSSLLYSAHRFIMPEHRRPRHVHGVQSRVQIPLSKSMHAYTAWLGMPIRNFARD